jgi:hypothetical protein
VSNALRRPPRRSPLRRGPVALVATLGCAIATASIVVTLAGAPSDDRPQPQRRSDSTTLTATEQAAVVAALSHRDPRQRRIAIQVATGDAGPSALADPAILHHHGIDTSRRPPRPRAEVAAERFHHR